MSEWRRWGRGGADEGQERLTVAESEKGEKTGPCQGRVGPGKTGSSRIGVGLEKSDYDWGAKGQA